MDPLARSIHSALQTGNSTVLACSIRNVLRAAAAVALGAAAPVYGADTLPQALPLEEVIITAQHREELLQDVPIAVSVATAEALKNIGVDATRDLPQLIPSVQFTRSGASGLFFIRGVGTTNAAAGEESSNSVYIDGVYQPDLAQGINTFNNIQRVEVIKGPQGTLFGRNATGGLIHIITREPGQEMVANFEAGYADYETISGQAYFGGPITEKISADIAMVKMDQGEGWGNNLTLNRESRTQDYQGARSKVVLNATESTKFTFAGDYFENSESTALAYKIDPGTLGTGGNTGPAGQDTTLNNFPSTDQEFYGGSVTAESDFGFATLTSISSYRRSVNRSDFDVDGGPLPLIRIAFTSGVKTFQQEIRLASNTTEPLSWQGGLFYLRPEADNNSNFSGQAFAAGGLQGQHILANLQTDSYAAFGEVTYSITPTTKLTGGVRYTEDQREFNGGQAPIPLGGVEGPMVKNPITSFDYDAVTYRASVLQEITEDINVYASFNRGFKSGSYNLQTPLNAPYRPQYIKASEIGMKSDLLGKRLRLNLSGYHYEIDDFQVRSAAVGQGSSVVLNAATVEVNGVDLEFEAAPMNSLLMFGGVTFLDSQFDKFGGPNAVFQAPIVYPNPATCPANLRGTRNPGVLTPGPRTGGFTTCFGDVSGNDTPNAPELTASLGASYSLPIGQSGSVRMTALYSYNDGYVFESDNLAQQGSFELVSASLEIRPMENYGIELWGRNLTDSEYAVQKLTSGTGVISNLGAPRTYGVKMKVNF